MSAITGIEWTDATWNPVVGCERISPGCAHCYAKTLHDRRHKAYLEGKQVLQQYAVPFETVQLKPERLEAPLHWRKPRRVFVNSVSDLFHHDVSDEFIAQVWQAMGAAPQHAYQILTKRPARALTWTTQWYSGEMAEPYREAPFPGFPGYRITTRGDVLGKRADTSGGMKLEAGEQGHLRVRLHRSGSPASGEGILVHRAVLTAFSRPPRAGEQALHLNGDASDNRLSNLRWGTQVDNWRDRIAHGTGQSWARLSAEDVAAIRTRAAAGDTASSIARDYPVSDTQIRNVLAGRQWVTPVHDRPLPPGARRVLDCAWLGVSVENQRWADERIPLLLKMPAAVRFLSCEPLLGPVNLTTWLGGWRSGNDNESRGRSLGLSWVIAGGESGPRCRPMDLDWARELRDECHQYGVPFFLKQLGGHPNKRADEEAVLEGRRHIEFPEVPR